MEKRKFEEEGKINIGTLILFYTIYLATLKVYTKFKDPGSTRSWNICNSNLLERKKNGQIKGLISNMWLILS